MYRGVYTALVTPFNADESVDESALRALVDFQIDGGVAGIVPMGTTGESPTVTHEENIEVVRIVADQVAGRAEVIAGTGSNSTAEAIRMTKLAAEVGATATLQVTPYYNKPTQEGLYAHFSTIADATNLPMVVYNIPGRTACNVETDTMIKLASHPRIVSVKEASGNMAQVMDVIARKPVDFDVLSGDDNLILPIVALGGVGIVSVASNIAPKLMGQLVDAALAGDFHAARGIHYRMLPLFQAIFLQTNPIPIKHMLAAAGMLKEVYRLPLTSLDEESAAAVDSIVKQVGPE
jgi:4-hydroxy-tetrahydrodipicolinate synthase